MLHNFRLFMFIGIASISAHTFFTHQKKYLNKVVRKYWSQSQSELRKDIGKKAVSVAGDARCESMGHSAKYSSYSLMDVSNNKILSVQLIQVSEWAMI